MSSNNPPSAPTASGGASSSNANAPAPGPTPAPAPAPAASGDSKSAGGGGSSSAPKTTTKKSSSAKTKSKAKKAGATKAKAPKKTTTGESKTTTTTAGSSTKRKKPASKASSNATNDALMEKARKAMTDLTKQRAQTEAKRSDPLWYRIEDVLAASNVVAGVQQSGSADAASTYAAGVLPEQIKIVESALSHNGMTITDVTPQAMACLLEHARRYASEIIEEARQYSISGMEVSKADLYLAVELREEDNVSNAATCISAQLPKLNLVAQQVNRVPLPAIPSNCYSGVVLPIEEGYFNHESDEAAARPSQLLTARTYDIVTAAQVAQKMMHPLPESPAVALTAPSSSSQFKRGSKKGATTTPGYGASRGRQIPIKLKKSETPTATAKTTSAAATPEKSATPTTAAASAATPPPKQDGPKSMDISPADKKTSTPGSAK